MSFNPLNIGPQSKTSSIALVTNYTNASAIDAIPQGMACSVIDSSGQLNPLDVSDNLSVSGRVGYAQVRIATSSEGPIISSGRLKHYTTALPVGTALYVGTDGNPTDIVPSIGVNGFLAGYAVIFIGIIVKSEDNPASKDIQLMTQLIGDL
jgi:hypothetical protein